MERLTARAYALSAFLIMIGGASLLYARGGTEARIDEQWMEERAPSQIPGYKLVPGPEGMAYTYKMDEDTYDILRPHGIVARQYTDGEHSFDAVLITSDSHESFHDPKICFSGQGWQFNSTRRETIEIPDGRVIPITIVEMTGPTEDAVAAYFYHGPRGYVSDPKRLQLDMFREVLFGRAPVDSTFYRFMPVGQGTGLEQLRGFIKTYMVAAAAESDGFF
jgi:hypothetical protein